MKNELIIILLLWGSGVIWAQEKRFAGVPSDNVIQNYLTETKMYATLYSGKIATPYDMRFENHPYFESNTYVSGTLGYNRAVYKNVLMRFDLYRNELTVISPERPYNIVIDNEKFDFAVLNGSTIVLSVSGRKSKEQFHVLLQNGTYPIVKNFNIVIVEDTSDRLVKTTFRIQQQYAIYIDGVPYPVKNKNSVLKLFADRRKELNEYAKQHKLNFRNQLEQSIIALVNHYENLTNVKTDLSLQ